MGKISPHPEPGSRQPDENSRPGLPTERRWLACLNLRHAAEPVLWTLLAFVVYFHLAQFVDKVGWNAIELIIAQKFTEHGVYATSLDYPSALTWRPLLPTLLVAFLQFWNEDPIRIYQWVCGLSIACLVGTMYLSGRHLGGRLAGHLAAFGTFTCPAVTTSLVGHIHSYSHLGAMLVLGPVLFASIALLSPDPNSDVPSPLRLGLTGFLWGLAYLCRSEMQLFFAVFAVLLAWRLWMRKIAIGRIAWACGAFLAVFIPYNAVAGSAANRDSLLSRKSIYGFYASQGWVDPAPGSGPDVEYDGYVYALKLYGDPLENGESLLTAIRRNPAAFQRRVSLNAGRFYGMFADPNFLSPWLRWAALLLVGIMAILPGLLPGRRLAVVFLVALFAATHFVLIFHIDSRYLAIAVPPLILVAALALSLVGLALRRRLPGLPANLLTALLLGIVAYQARSHYQRLWEHPARSVAGLTAMRSLGEHFRATVPKPILVKNREPHIVIILPALAQIPGEDVFLLPYFSHTAWMGGGAEGLFPRGKIYSFRLTEYDYLYLPAERIDEAQYRDALRLGDYVNPVLGRYYLIGLHR